MCVWFFIKYLFIKKALVFKEIMEYLLFEDTCRSFVVKKLIKFLTEERYSISMTSNLKSLEEFYEESRSSLWSRLYGNRRLEHLNHAKYFPFRQNINESKAKQPSRIAHSWVSIQPIEILYTEELKHYDHCNVSIKKQTSKKENIRRCTL